MAKHTIFVVTSKGIHERPATPEEVEQNAHFDAFLDDAVHAVLLELIQEKKADPVPIVERLCDQMFRGQMQFAFAQTAEMLRRYATAFEGCAKLLDNAVEPEEGEEQSPS
jgi:hypothetical protein